jgi:hypothetical protein
MNHQQTFKAVIENAGGGGAFVRVPFDVEQVFGSKRPKVKATFDGVPYRGTLVRMGEPCHILPILKEIRARIGKDFGDRVEVCVEADTEPRSVEVPPDLQQALDADPAAGAAFRGLAYSHQREHVRAVLEAKREATRRSRIQKTIAALKAAKK